MITALTRINYLRHFMVGEMAEQIRRCRVRGINDQHIERVHFELVGQQ